MATSEEKQLMASMAGTNVAFWKQTPELWKLFNKALDDGYSPDRLLAESKNTKWYKRHAESVRKAQALKVQDPAEYKRQVAIAKANIRKMANELGMPITGNLNVWARLAFVNQWSEHELRAKMGTSALQRRIKAGHAIGGTLGQAMDRMNAAAYNNGVKLDNNTKASWIARIANGSWDDQAILSNVQRRAAALFPGFKDDIMAGVSVREAASGYLDRYAELMELNPGDVDLFNTDIRKAINTKDKDGKFSPLSLEDFETRIRRSAKWQKTANARDSYMEGAHAILQGFGVTW